jgi:hypothetical protein
VQVAQEHGAVLLRHKVKDSLHILHWRDVALALFVREGFNILKAIARGGKLLEVLYTPISCSYQVFPGLVRALAASLISHSLQKLSGLAPGDLIHSGILPKLIISNSGCVLRLLKGLGNIAGLAILKIAGPPF